MKKGQLGIIAMLTMLLGVYSCDEGFTKLESGFEYKMLVNEEGRKAVPGDYMMINLKSFSGDSLMIDRRAADGFGLDPLRGVPENMQEILALCDEGDSIHVRMNLIQYAMLTRMSIPNYMDTTSNVVMHMKIVEVDNEASILARRKAEREARQQKQMEDFMAEKGLEGTLSPDGIYNIIKEEGTGAYPKPGQRVSVNYVVRLLDGTFIDTSYEEVARAEGDWSERRMPYHPYEFTVGNDNVIGGWHLGIPLVKEGGKSTLLIPSDLGYGSNVRPGSPVPPNAVLVYDVEVVEIIE